MKVSVIIPCYNEEEVLPLSHKRFSQVMESTAHDYELIFHYLGKSLMGQG